MTAQKDTLYIDVDDEITTIVDKVNASSSKIVALVLPKRAAVLQSIVNMKLLKRTADDSGKRVVLITSEAGLLPLAGAVGVYVAKNLQSKPEIPAAPDDPQVDEDVLEAEEPPEDPDIDKDAPVGKLAGDEAPTDDDLFEPVGAAAAATAPAARKAAQAKATKAPKAKKGHGSGKIPNFEIFRKKVFIAIAGLIALLILVYLAFFVLPKASVAITTETSDVNSSIDFVASPSAQTADIEGGVVPAKEVESQKTETQKVAATGQKDLGTKASGQVAVSNCTDNEITVPAGTAVSSNGLNFITQATIQLDEGDFNSGGVCKSSGDHVASVRVVAQNNGDQYNLANNAAYSVAGFSGAVTGRGSAMSGGSSKIAKVVSQQDVDNAKQKITDATQEVKAELQKQLEAEDYYAMLDTFATKNESITASPEVGQEASEVTVTATRVYAMTGVKRDDLRALIENSVKSEKEDRKLRVQNDGLDQASFRLGDRKEDGTANVTMQVRVALGPNIDTEQLKKDIAGKKKGDVENAIKEFDGVESVEVTYSPFWVSATPKNTGKITIDFKEANN